MWFATAQVTAQSHNFLSLWRSLSFFGPGKQNDLLELKTALLKVFPEG